MMEIPGYELGEKIHEGQQTVVHRARRVSDRKPFILKILKSEYPANQEINRLRHEYLIVGVFESDNIIKIEEIFAQNNVACLVMEDFGGISLRKIAGGRPLGLKEFLKLAARVTGILNEIHMKNVIHKDIKPSNIIFNQQTDRIKIADFGISTRLTRENPIIKSADTLEGTLEYISPEQTGRMNRSIDYRSDFYSLGVTFFELLTGRLPFPSTDPVEMVHCHIARLPPAPHEVKADIPEIISRIVLKLMAKNAEDRYQSARGLEIDLEECLRRLDADGRIEPFELGREDVTDRFILPQKLYGREEQLARMLEIFKRVERGRSEFLLVSGYSGIGKSSLINETHKPIVASAGFFVSGKFDQFKRNVPYNALIEAFEELIRQILTLGDEKIRTWKDALLRALDPNARIIIDVIPELELILGKQPDVPMLDPAESQNRFCLVFQNFIRVFAQPTHPLALFLDDLQWADTATLNLIKFLLTDPENRNLLLMGAYRDNEVNESHPLLLTLRELKQEGGIVNDISLEALSREDLSALVADALNSSLEEAEGLAELTMQKTLGNPFFVNQFLGAMYRKELISFDYDKRKWVWDIDKIKAADITDNVVDLLTDRLSELSERTLHILQMASCLGNRFSLRMLSFISKETPDALLVALDEPLREGLVHLTETHDLVIGESSDGTKIEDAVYRFLHDRVHQASYALIEPERKKELHLSLGRHLMGEIPEQELEEHIFEIVGHINAGSDLIRLPMEKIGAARLNFIAGKKAKDSTAYEPAVRYFRAGIEQLPETMQTPADPSAYSLFRELAEAEYLNGNLEESERLFELLLEGAQTKAQKADVCQLRITQYNGSNRILDGIEVAKYALGMLGFKIPADADLPAQTQAENRKMRRLLKGKNIHDLLDQPAVTDPEIIHAMALGVGLWFAAYLSGRQSLVAYMSVKNLNFCLEHGNALISSSIYVNYGLMCCGGGKYELGYEFGKLAVDLARKTDARSMMAKVFQLYPFIHHWTRPVTSEIPYFKEGFQAGLESGDLVNAGYCLVNGLRNRIIDGENLDQLHDECKGYPAFCRRTGDFLIAGMLQFLVNLLQALRGKTDEPFRLNNEDFNEESYETSVAAPDKVLFLSWYMCAKMQLLYLGERYAEAVEFSRRANVAATLPSQLQVVEFSMYTSLAMLASLDSASAEEKKARLSTVAENQKLMRKWMKSCPENFEHRFLLTEAERMRVRGEMTRALDLYDRAIKSARNAGYVQNEALANHLAAKFFCERNRPKAARGYLLEARYLYRRWGGHALVRLLEERFPELQTASKTPARDATRFAQETSTISRGTFTSETSGPASTSTTNILDMAAVIKASQALAGEIVLERLLKNMMKIMIENAGAQTGKLLLFRKEGLFIEAEGAAQQQEISVLKNIRVDESNADLLPRSVINYVMRTSENVVLGDASAERKFNQDPYIARNKIRSLLASPIINKGKLEGILYLENNLVADAFTEGRLETLNILSGQAAISIENALLYDTLDAKVEERTRELKNAQAKLIQSEKMASLGQLIAGIAHEVNTPMGAIKASIDNISVSQKEMLAKLEVVLEKIPRDRLGLFIALIQDPMEEVRQFTTREERAFRRAITQLLEEKRIKESQYVAETLVKIGIVENVEKYLPLFEGDDNLAIADMAYHIARQNKNTENIKIAIDRVTKIVFALKSFSHSQNDDAMVSADVIEGIETVLVLYHNQLKHGVEVEREFESLPKIRCFPDELVQVWTNIIHNSIQAIEGKGRLKIEARQADREIVVRISDNGPGIPPEFLERIFEPFFTTKPKGEGSGLGLGICRRIVDKHGGKIEVETEPGRTTFIVRLPMGE